MASTWSVCKGLAAVVITSAAAFALCPNAAADPATPQPNPTQQLPGLPALAQLSPIIQQAAMNPAQATQLLMAAASAFAGNPAVPTESKNVASSVNQFVAEPTNPDSAALGVPAPHGVALPEAIPVPHVPPLGAEPGVQAHLPTGIDPSHAAGPAPAVAPTVTPPVAAPPASAHTGLHVPLDRPQLCGGRQQFHRDRAVGGGARQDPAARSRTRPDRLRVHGRRHAGARRRAEVAAERHVGEPDHGKVRQRHPAAAFGHQSGRTDHVDRNRRHRFRQHHVNDLRAGDHQGPAVPVHADDRLNGGALAPAGMVHQYAMNNMASRSYSRPG